MGSAEGVGVGVVGAMTVITDSVTSTRMQYLPDVDGQLSDGMAGSVVGSVGVTVAMAVITDSVTSTRMQYPPDVDGQLSDGIEGSVVESIGVLVMGTGGSAWSGWCVGVDGPIEVGAVEGLELEARDVVNTSEKVVEDVEVTVDH